MEKTFSWASKSLEFYGRAEAKPVLEWTKEDILKILESEKGTQRELGYYAEKMIEFLNKNGVGAFINTFMYAQKKVRGSRMFYCNIHLRLVRSWYVNNNISVFPEYQVFGKDMRKGVISYFKDGKFVRREYGYATISGIFAFVTSAGGRDYGKLILNESTKPNVFEGEADFGQSVKFEPKDFTYEQALEEWRGILNRKISLI